MGGSKLFELYENISVESNLCKKKIFTKEIVLKNILLEKYKLYEKLKV